ncbi:2-oxoglutarate (2OG) and Fe(II)-dependent oxygenase superfamily protein [Euphorbia peplus]|nr:2-oxoglutarate (2OG) and Fe(II)-dependent oxygenase superfamily protein [Euphorbia peplus]
MGLERVVSRNPVVELSGEKLKAGSDSWNSACQEVRKALEQYGCFELVYKKHNVENQKSILEAMQQFFSLPDEIKTKNTHRDFGHAYAYNGKSSILPISETARIENATNKQAWQNFTHLMWPHGNQHFCETVHPYSMLLAEMQEVLVKMLCESYGIGKEYIDSHLKSTSYLISFHKYERSNQADTKLGLTDHTDKSFLSVLHQNHVNGLKIRLEDDRWGFYQPSSDYSSFIVLAGDACMGWSNDRIKSRYHRVMVEGEEVRYSVGSFGFVKGLIKTPKELIDEEHPMKYKPFDQRQFAASCNCHCSTDANNEIDANKIEMTNLKEFCGI